MTAPTASLTSAVRVVVAAAAALETATEELCALDSVAGDGDHGFAMRTAAQGIRSALTSAPPNDERGLVALLAEQFSAIGGSMGALVSVALEELGHQLADRAVDGSLDADTVAVLFATVSTTLSDFGGAEVGDKTIVDAAAAAADGAAAARDAGADVAATLDAAADGAERGSAGTAGLDARVGRASRLGGRSLGHVDPGARSYAIAARAIAMAYSTSKGSE